MSADWKDIVKAVAPGVAGLLYGPLAATAVRALSQKLLGKDDGTEDEIAAAVSSGNPEALARIKEAEASLKTALANAGVKLEEIGAADRASARGLAVARGISPQVILSAIFLGGFFWSLWFIIEQLSGAKLDTDIKLMVASMLGMFSREIPTIMQFWFGTSSGSKEKDKTLDRIVNHKE